MEKLLKENKNDFIKSLFKVILFMLACIAGTIYIATMDLNIFISEPNIIKGNVIADYGQYIDVSYSFQNESVVRLFNKPINFDASSGNVSLDINNGVRIFDEINNTYLEEAKENKKSILYLALSFLFFSTCCLIAIIRSYKYYLKEISDGKVVETSIITVMKNYIVMKFIDENGTTHYLDSNMDLSDKDLNNTINVLVCKNDYYIL